MAEWHIPQNRNILSIWAVDCCIPLSLFLTYFLPLHAYPNWAKSPENILKVMF